MSGAPGNEMLYGTEYEDATCGLGGRDIVYSARGTHTIDAGDDALTNTASEFDGLGRTTASSSAGARNDRAGSGIEKVQRRAHRRPCTGGLVAGPGQDLVAAAQARIDAFERTYKLVYPAAVKFLLSGRQHPTTYLRFPAIRPEHHTGSGTPT